ncbi:MAG: SGNH/GDSL hydrolase family protein, partial [Bacteroidota bacterium]|nr:SGNH/GDSL hydrolase family protein [Bacteroidota bacterium]
EHFDLIDLYNKKRMGLQQLVKYKRLKDPGTGTYKNYPYPEYIDIPFNPATDEYPYPPEAMDVTFDGLHPSDKGFAMIANMLIDKLKKF